MPGFTLQNSCLGFIFRALFMSWFKISCVFIIWNIYFSLHDTFPFLSISWYSTNTFIKWFQNRKKKKKKGKWDFPYRNTTCWAKARKIGPNIAIYKWVCSRKSSCSAGIDICRYMPRETASALLKSREVTKHIWLSVLQWVAEHGNDNVGGSLLDLDLGLHEACLQMFKYFYSDSIEPSRIHRLHYRMIKCF